MIENALFLNRFPPTVEVLPWWVKSSAVYVRQSKITKGTVLAGLGGKELIWYINKQYFII